jgi:deoxyribonuclease V
LKYENAINLQRAIASKVIAHDYFSEIKRVCGVDVAYDGYTAYCSAVVMEKGKVVVESVECKTTVSYPYVPGLMMLREATPIFQTVKLLKSYDLLLIDGHGLLHPRKCGLACYVGVTLDKPTIGVAKSRLCGTVRPDGYIEVSNEILGCIVDRLYVSIGHRISLETAIILVKKLGTDPLRLADINSKAQKRRKE